MPRFSRVATSVIEIIGGVLLLALARTGLAHHSNAIYDLEHSVTIDGVVSAYEWVNPHVYLHVETVDAAGMPSVWLIEASPPTLMVRRGWSPSTFAVGEHVSVEAYPAKRADRKLALVRSVQKADGSSLVVNSNDPRTSGRAFAVPPALEAADDLSGTWVTLLTPGNGAMEFVFGPMSWTLTGAGANAIDDYDDSANPAVDCVAYTAPFSMVFPDEKTLVLGPETVHIRSSLDGAERTVLMNTPTHEGAVPSNQGHSIGRWDGSTLVVDTARFAARRNGNAFKLPSSDAKHLVERFALSEDRKRLVYSFTLEDPVYLAAPVTGTIEWQFAPGRAFPAEACDPDNARRYLQGFED